MRTTKRTRVLKNKNLQGVVKMNLLKNKNQVITYTVNKAINHELYISVQNGEVVINAPWYTSSNQIQKIVEEKKQWILQKIKEYEITCEKKKEYVKTKQIKVLGKNYALKIEYKNKTVPTLDIQENSIQIILPNVYKKMGKPEEMITILLDKMYHMVAKKEIEKAMEKTRILLGIAPEDYTILKSNRILAKCTEGRISISTTIATYDRKVIEYVILHEFCHLKYKNHTKSFYQMLETYMPEYQQYVDEISHLQY